MTNMLEVTNLVKLNHELLDANYNLFTRLVQIYKKNGVSLDAETETLLLNVRRVLQEINAQTPKLNAEKINSKTPEDEQNSK